MHIPDGFLDAPTATASGALAVAALGWSARQCRLRLPPRRVPLLGLAAAFVFAAQMLNFPVVGGTSGHLIGGVLCSVLLGPAAAVLVISSVLIVQCLAFGDGGILALGANIFNMAVVDSVGGYLIYRAISGNRPSPQRRLFAVTLAAWAGAVLAAVACAGELAMAHTVAWTVALPAMAGVHMLIGIGEAVITTLAIFSIWQTRPDLLSDESARADGLVFGALIALGLAVFISPFASKWPDGLDHVAASLGFAARQVQVRTSPIPGYHIPGIHSPALATALAGGLGTLVMLAVGWSLAKVLVRRLPASDGAPDA